jgi:hypothetical protein
MKGGLHMADSTLFKQIGRITFLLSSFMVASAGCGALQLLRSHAESRRAYLVIGYGLVLLGVFWLRSLEHRLRDAGLPRWFFWPYFLIVFTACLGARAYRILDDSQTLMLFAALQFPSVLFRSKPASAESLLRSASCEGAQEDSDYNQPVGRLLFLLRLLLLAAFWAALFHLQGTAGCGLALWELRLGLVIVLFVWIYNVEGRLLDAGLPRSISIPYCLIVPGACLLPVWFRVIDLPLALALFVILQIPEVFFHSKAIVAAPLPQVVNLEEKQSSRSSLKSKPVHKIEPIGSFEFAVYILLIAGLSSALFLLRSDVVGGVRAWGWDAVLDAVSLLILALWIVSVKGRLKAADRTRSYIDLCSIVIIPCLLLFAYSVISFSQALALFVILQIPIVFIRQESILAKLFLADTNS